ncbi:MAG: hypothetical protein ACM3ML_24495 [Micromonosporaceae bacterium]
MSRRIDLSINQVVASALATITAAVLASYVGVAGTLIGAAVGSAASTVGTAVYRYYLGRTSERLRLAARAARQARTHEPAGGAGPGPAVQGPARPEQPTGSISWPREAYFPFGEGRAILGVTRIIASQPAGDEPREPAANGRGWRRWPIFTGVAAGIFALAIGGITVVEALMGRPVSNIVWQKPGAGTSLGDVLSGTNQGSPRPSSPAPTPSHSPAHSSGTQGPTVTPSPSASLSSNQPSLSVSPSPSASPSPSPTGSSPAPPTPAPTG